MTNPSWVAPILQSVENLSDVVKDVRDDTKEIREEMREIRSEVGGKEGLRERVTKLEGSVAHLVETVSDLAGRETTPVSIVSTRKPSIKDHGITAGVAGIVVAVIEVAGQYLKTK